MIINANYDQFGHEGPQGGFGSQGFGGGDFGGFSGGGFEDIFSSFFGGGSRQRDPMRHVKVMIYNIL